MTMRAKILPRAVTGTDANGRPGPGYQAAEEPRDRIADRSIGDFIREVRNLDDSQIEEILGYQRQHQVRFGEAAMALKLASSEDVLWALSQQFHYPYAASNGAAGFVSGELINAIDPFSDEAEMFRDIRTQLVMGVLAPDQPRRALAVMSPNIGDGKTFFAANLAIGFSQLGARTLLIDADMRTPRLHELFGVPGHAGLSSILAGRAEVDVIHQSTASPGLYVLPVGTPPPNPLELMHRPTFGLLLQELMTKFDHIVVDTPAASHGADARVLGAKCGAALLIGRRGVTRMDAMQSLIDHLNKAQAGVAGVMINEH